MDKIRNTRKSKKEDFARYTLRVDKELLEKMHVVASYNGRSVNRELEQMMKKRIAAYEMRNGVIADTDLED